MLSGCPRRFDARRILLFYEGGGQRSSPYTSQSKRTNKRNRVNNYMEGLLYRIRGAFFAGLAIANIFSGFFTWGRDWSSCSRFIERRTRKICPSLIFTTLALVPVWLRYRLLHPLRMSVKLAYKWSGLCFRSLTSSKYFSGTKGMWPPVSKS